MITAQLCAVLLLVIIFYMSFRIAAPRIRNVRSFKTVMYVSLASVILDANSIIMIANINSIGVGITKFWCKAYLVSLILVGFSAFHYLMGDLYFHDRFMKLQFPSKAFAFIGSVAVSVSEIKIHQDGEEIYTYGFAVLLTYAFALFFIVLTFFTAFIMKRYINLDRRKGVLIWMGMLLVAAVIQFFNNELLLVGYASSLGVLFLFSVLENPTSYVDMETGLYNMKSMREYATEELQNGYSLYGIMVTMNTLTKDLSVAESRKILITVAYYFNMFEDVMVFRLEHYSFALMLRDNSKIPILLEHLRMFFTRLEDEMVEFSGITVRYNVLRDPDVFMNHDEFFNTYYRIKSMEDGNEVSYVDRALVNSVLLREKSKQDIINALHDDRIDVFFQPIYDNRTNSFTSAEALVRMYDEDGNIISPAEFIPTAEETGLIIPLGERIFNKVCDFIHDNNIESLGVSYIEVNLSAVQCEHKNLYRNFASIMKEKGIDPKWINFEITETMQLNTSKAINKAITQFLDLGIKFSLDDFGTGNSNLDYMAKVPVSIIKFDYTMTQSYFTNNKTKVIFKHVVPMIQDLGLEIVCEGIETKEQFDTMRSFGVEHIQGYYFSKPLKQADYLEFLKKNKESE